MSGRGWLYVAMVAIAIGGPYLSSQSGKDGAHWWDSMWSDDIDGAPPLVSIGSLKNDAPTSSLGGGDAWHAPPLVTKKPLVVPSMPMVRSPEPPLPTLPEALRFDLSPEWVSHRWPHVWRQYDEKDLSSLRVTMVSGTRLTDLAGSLTYSFDKAQQLQRIELDGTCGDPSELIMIVTQHYGLQPMSVVGGYQFVARGTRNGIVSALRIDNASVIRQSVPFERYRVSLELNHPGGRRQISDRMREKLDLPASDAAHKDAKDKKDNKSPSKPSVDAAYEKDPRRPLDALLQ